MQGATCVDLTPPPRRSEWIGVILGHVSSRRDRPWTVLHNALSFQRLFQLTTPAEVTALLWSPTGKLLAAGLANGEVHLCPGPGPLNAVPGHTQTICLSCPTVAHSICVLHFIHLPFPLLFFCAWGGLEAGRPCDHRVEDGKCVVRFSASATAEAVSSARMVHQHTTAVTHMCWVSRRLPKAWSAKGRLQYFCMCCVLVLGENCI